MHRIKADLRVLHGCMQTVFAAQMHPRNGYSEFLNARLTVHQLGLCERPFQRYGAFQVRLSCEAAQMLHLEQGADVEIGKLHRSLGLVVAAQRSLPVPCELGGLKTRRDVVAQSLICGVDNRIECAKLLAVDGQLVEGCPRLQLRVVQSSRARSGELESPGQPCAGIAKTLNLCDVELCSTRLDLKTVHTQVVAARSRHCPCRAVQRHGRELERAARDLSLGAPAR